VKLCLSFVLLAFASLGAATLACGPSAPPPTRAGPNIASSSSTDAQGKKGIDRAAAADALEELQEDASRCGAPGSPAGDGRIAIMFDPATGGVSETKLEEPFAFSTVGPCVDRVFRSAKVAPFAGPPVKVVVPFFVAQANAAPGFSARAAKTAVRDAVTHCSMKLLGHDVVADELRVKWKQDGTVTEASFFRAEDHGPIEESNATRCVRKALKEAKVAAFSSDEERAAVRVFFSP
jgi:hypothetical protein